MRLLVLDDMLPRGLADELAARGRPARTLADLGLEGARDADVLAAIDAVLVTADAATAGARVRARGRPAVAFVAARPGPTRRDAVHRHAHEMAAQRPGSVHRYS